MTMKIQAMLDWSPEEKAAKAKEWAQSLFTLRLQKATGQLENPMKIKELRKDIARLKTAQHMSAAEAAAAAAAAEAHEAAAAHVGIVRRERFFEGERGGGGAEAEGPRRRIGEGREEARARRRPPRRRRPGAGRPIHLLRNLLRPTLPARRPLPRRSSPPPEEKQEEVVRNRKQ